MFRQDAKKRIFTIKTVDIRILKNDVVAQGGFTVLYCKFRFRWREKMAFPEHLAKISLGVKAWNKWRKDNPHIKPNLSGADLGKITLRGAHLCGADISEANLEKAHLIGANLIGANLIGANLKEADLRGANIRKADLGGANLREANLNGTDLRGANLDGADLTHATFEEANMEGTEVSD